MVHRSLLAWLPTPSVTHVPPLVSWQYAEPLVTCHMALEASGGNGGGGGGGGGGEGEGGGGGIADAVVEPQMMNPPDVTLPSELHDIVAPAAICTLAGPVVPAY